MHMPAAAVLTCLTASDVVRVETEQSAHITTMNGQQDIPAYSDTGCRILFDYQQQAGQL
jgi:hypothetical protein